MRKEGLKINQRIEANNLLIEKAMQPNFFTLNNIVAELLKENEQLQQKCPHEFVDGFCIYCYKAEE